MEYKGNAIYVGKITVSDFDLLKYKNRRIEEIIELKRSKKTIEEWKPYPADYPNFALLINTIIQSGRRIPFTLYYNVLKDGPAGEREQGIFTLEELLCGGNGSRCDNGKVAAMQEAEATTEFFSVVQNEGGRTGE